MALSGNLVARYTSEVDVDWRSAIVLEHPNAGILRLIDYTEEFTGYGNATVDPALRVYAPLPMQVQLPARDQSGRSDMGIVWDGYNDIILNYLNAAIVDGTQPIICRYTIYILTDPNPQISPFLEFKLTGISATETRVTATASRADIINRAFPTVIYRTDMFPGLRRR